MANDHERGGVTPNGDILREVDRVEALAGGRQLVFLTCGHLKNTKTKHHQAGDLVRCPACENRSPMIEAGLGQHRILKPAGGAGLVSCGCYLNAKTRNCRR